MRRLNRISLVRIGNKLKEIATIPNYSLGTEIKSGSHICYSPYSDNIEIKAKVTIRIEE